MKIRAFDSIFVCQKITENKLIKVKTMGRITSMGLIVAEKSFKNATNHRMEATIGMMVSGNKNFPVLFGETNEKFFDYGIRLRS